MSTESRPATAPGGPLLHFVQNQKVAFALVGGVNTVIGFGWFALVHTLAGNRIGYLGALVIAYALAILCAFLMHRHLVFKVKGHFWLDLLRFTMVNISSLGINLVLLPVAVEVFGLPVLPAQVIVMSITVVVSYFAHLSFSFRRQHAGPGYLGTPVDD